MACRGARADVGLILCKYGDEVKGRELETLSTMNPNFFITAGLRHVRSPENRPSLDYVIIFRQRGFKAMASHGRQSLGQAWLIRVQCCG